MVAPNPRAGHCYRLAWDHLRGNPKHEPVLIHGTVSLHGGPRLGHAWVEESPQIGVFEPENGAHMSREEFERVFAPEEIARFTRTEAAVEMLRHGHYGPWAVSNGNIQTEGRSA